MSRSIEITDITKACDLKTGDLIIGKNLRDPPFLVVINEYESREGLFFFAVLDAKGILEEYTLDADQILGAHWRVFRLFEDLPAP
jgi:hypothetical protein